MGQLAVIRADASPTIGGGHVMRCLALANGLRANGWTCLFACGDETLMTSSMLTATGHGHVQVPGDLSAAEQARCLRSALPEGADLLVVDHYGLDQDFGLACLGWARKILVVDDLANRALMCNILLDQNLGRAAADYDGLVPSACTRLIGPAFALLGPQFALAGRPRSRSGPVRRAAVSMGLTDPWDVTSKAIQALQAACPDTSIDVALGSRSANAAKVGALAADDPDKVHLYLDCGNMAAFYALADIAVGAFGVSSWERCSMGLPSIGVITADNQRVAAAALAQEGAVLLAGEAAVVSIDDLVAHLNVLCSDAEARATIADRACRICDGHGVARILAALESNP